MSRPSRLIAIALLAALPLLGSSPLLAQPQDSGGGTLDTTAQAVWDREWSLYAARYTVRDGEFYACAKYHPSFPSSLGVTAAKLVESNTRSRTVTFGGNMSRQVRTVPNQVDAQIAAAALPAVTFGEYGKIHSVEVVQVLGPQEMIVRQLWLIDAQALNEQITQARAGERDRDRDNEVDNLFQFRQQLADRQRQEDSFRSGGVLLLGFSTEDLREGQRWLGPQNQGLEIAITGTKTLQYTPSSRSSRTRTSSSARPREIEVAVALPLSAFRGRISREQFNEMLVTRAMTLSEFVELTIAEKKKDPDNAIFNAIRRLEANKPAPAPAAGEQPGEAGTERTPRSRRTRQNTQP